MATQILSRLSQILRRRSAAELLVMLADRAVRPFAISLLSYTRYGAVPPPARAESAKDQFDTIAQANLWGSRESLSGGGSEVARTASYRSELVELLRSRGFRSMFDAPCGDLNWIPLVLEQVELDYVGGDISRSIIALNRARYPHLSFLEFDITRDEFPTVDVWHCRDCLFHLSYRDIEAALRNFLESGIPYALLTSHVGLVRNVDVPTGGWRALNLRRPPFAFPTPLEKLSDSALGDILRIVGLWSRRHIEDALANARLLDG